MIKKLAFVLSFVSGIAVAQQNNAAVIVVGRVLNAEDSVQVKEKFFNGLKAKLANKSVDSEGYFKEVIGIDPSNHAALYELACIYHLREEESTAEKYARDAVTVNSQNKWYWLLLADIYKSNKNLGQLALVYSDLINLEPDNEEYYFDKANVYFLSNKIKEAETVYSDIEKRFGTSAELINARQRIYQKQGNPNKAASEIEKLIVSSPSDVRNYLNLASVYEKSGHLDKALVVLQNTKSLGISNAFVNLAIADIYNNLGKKDDAIAELRTAFADPSLAVDAKVGIVLSFFTKFKDPSARADAAELAKIITEVHPTEAKSYSVYGDVLYQDGKLSEARQTYKKAIELNNQAYLVWEQVLRIDISTGDFQSAIKDGEDGISIFPAQAPLYFYTAIAYAQSGKHDKAIVHLQEAANLEVEDKNFLSQIYSSLGDSYNGLKKYKESDDAYNKALELNPDNTYVLNNYAYYLSLRGENLEKAAQMSAKSVSLQPGNASFEDTYAWVLFKQKKYAEAKTWIEKAIQKNNSSGVLAEHYGDILYFMGLKSEALEQWLRARETGVKSLILEKKINEKKFFD